MYCFFGFDRDSYWLIENLEIPRNKVKGKRSGVVVNVHNVYKIMFLESGLRLPWIFLSLQAFDKVIKRKPLV